MDLPEKDLLTFASSRKSLCKFITATVRTLFI